MNGLRPMRNLCAVLGGCCVIALVAGCSENRLVDEKNPYYVRGLQLLRQRHNREAAAAFEKCLRYSPDSAKAHLQLGMLYQDAFDDPASAVHHFRRYLEKRPDSDDADVVQRWLGRAEEAFFHELATRLGVDEMVMDVPEGTGETEGRTETVLTEREKRLAKQIRTLNSEILVLRRRLKERGAPADPVQDATDLHRAKAVADSRVETGAKTYRVTQGDTLSGVCRQFYGASKYWPLLRDYNSDVLRDKATLMPGMLLRIPPVKELERHGEIP